MTYIFENSKKQLQEILDKRFPNWNIKVWTDDEYYGKIFADASLHIEVYDNPYVLKEVVANLKRERIDNVDILDELWHYIYRQVENSQLIKDLEALENIVENIDTIRGKLWGVRYRSTIVIMR